MRISDLLFPLFRFFLITLLASLAVRNKYPNATPLPAFNIWHVVIINNAVLKFFISFEAKVCVYKFTIELLRR